MKVVRYTAEAAKDLRRYTNMATRVRQAISEYAASGARANQVTRLVGSTASRMRVGEFRVIFEEDESGIVVTKIGPRGTVYE